MAAGLEQHLGRQAAELAAAGRLLFRWQCLTTGGEGTAPSLVVSVERLAPGLDPAGGGAEYWRSTRHSHSCRGGCRHWNTRGGVVTVAARLRCCCCICCVTVPVLLRVLPLVSTKEAKSVVARLEREEEEEEEELGSFCMI